MVSVQRMRMLLPNAHVDLDAAFVRPLLNRPCETIRSLSGWRRSKVGRPWTKGLSRERMDRRLPRQDFALNLSAKRRLCNTVGGRVIEGAPRCCAVSTARSRAAATTNLARSNHSLVLYALFGGAKSCALVDIFMIAPDGRLVSPTTTKFCP